MLPDREALPAGPAGEDAGLAIASRDEDLLYAWDRLLAIAALYPPDNTRFRGSLDAWRETLRPLARSDGSLCVEIGRDGRLACEGRVLAPARVVQSRFYPLLLGIGVEHVLISLAIAPAAMHRLLVILRDAQRTAERSIGFQHAELPALPAGVTVALRSFGSPGETLLRAADGDPAHEQQRGAELSPEVTAPEHAVPAPVLSNPHVGLQGETIHALEDRLTENVTALYRSLTQDLAPDPVPATEPSAPPVAAPAPKAATPPPLPFDADSFQARLGRLEGELPLGAEQLGPSQAEWLAFLLQQALAPEESDARERARVDLAAQLAQPVGLQGLQMLLSAGEQLLAGGDADAVDAQLPLLLAPLAKQAPALQSLFPAWVDGASAVAREMLWPHLADALLGGLVPVSLAQLRSADGETALALAEEARPRLLARLEQRPSLLDASLPAAIFRPLRPELRPLLLLLLLSSRSVIAGAQLHAALRESGLPPPFAALLTLLGDFKPSHRELYRLLLRADEEGAALAREAAGHAIGVLQRLPRAERGRPEVADCLLTLEAAPAGEADALLDRVTLDRRLPFWPAWPRAARRQASTLKGRRRRHFAAARREGRQP